MREQPWFYLFFRLGVYKYYVYFDMPQNVPNDQDHFLKENQKALFVSGQISCLK